MKIWFDTEFIEDGKTIDLLSIGALREDGRQFYAELEEADLSKASDWVKKNVLPHLQGPLVQRPRHVIALSFKEFAGKQPEFWAYYADYDWVALCQLYGKMVDLPDSWPMFCRDVKQLCMDRGNPRLPPRRGVEHHALSDARWVYDAWKFLQSMPPEAGLIESPEDVDRRTMLNESAVAEAIDAEPELPGPMPDAMWEAIRHDRDAATEALRIIVRQTKQGIKERLGCSCGPQKGSE